MTQYYDGTKLLSLNDINGNKPEIYMCTANRTAGKTAYFSRLLVNKFLRNGQKFGLLYRFNYELDDCAEKFFKDIGMLFFENKQLTAKKRAKGIYSELFLDEVPCGYALTLNSADQIKKMSHLFSDIDFLMFDEFQSETNKYCPDEIKKFISVHTSIARGHGKQVRYVPVYMVSNAVSIINPYYTEMGISSRLQSNTKFLRGEGFVLEQGYVDSAARAQTESGFYKAFSANSYTQYASQNVYLNDNMAFIERPEGRGRYIATIRYMNVDYGVREYAEQGIIYCDNKADSSYPYKLAVTTEDHNINYVMLKRCDPFIDNMRYLFNRGCYRFHDLKCKEAVMRAISY